MTDRDRPMRLLPRGDRFLARNYAVDEVAEVIIACGQAQVGIAKLLLEQ
ncbi:MAG: hypothetical protein M2R46_05644 [Verrucomicrobia subdivision 3 bacterium]|nr:hypothetical protein [Limisphaerales bacterium]